MSVKITDVPEKVIAWCAKVFGIDTIEVVDRLVIRGDNIFLSLRGLSGVDVDEEVQCAWVWSRDDEKDAELDELIESTP